MPRIKKIKKETIEQSQWPQTHDHTSTHLVFTLYFGFYKIYFIDKTCYTPITHSVASFKLSVLPSLIYDRLSYFFLNQTSFEFNYYTIYIYTMHIFTTTHTILPP